MSTRWFKRAGWVYVPVGASGVAAYLLAAAFCVNVFWAVDRHSHSASDTLYGVFPYFVCAFLLLDWLGRNTSSAGAKRAGGGIPESSGVP